MVWSAVEHHARGLTNHSLRAWCRPAAMSLVVWVRGRPTKHQSVSETNTQRKRTHLQALPFPFVTALNAVLPKGSQRQGLGEVDEEHEEHEE